MRNETTTAVEREEREERDGDRYCGVQGKKQSQKDTVAQETPQFLSREKREVREISKEILSAVL